MELRLAAASGDPLRLQEAIKGALVGGRLNAKEAAGALERAASAGPLESVEALLAAGADPMAGQSAALEVAARRDRADIVQRLLPLSNALAGESKALRAAAEAGSLECVRLLIPASNPRSRGSEALGLAAEAGELECVRLLIPVSDPRAGRGDILFRAAKAGRLECVRLLLPASDPGAGFRAGLSGAGEGGSIACARLIVEELGGASREIEDALAMGLMSAAACGEGEFALWLLSEAKGALPRSVIEEAARRAGRYNQDAAARLIMGALAAQEELAALEGELGGSADWSEAVAGGRARRVGGL